MTTPPRLLAGQRRNLALLLVMLALGEAVLAVLFAAALDRLLVHQAASAMPALAAAGLVLMAGIVLLVARWVGETFAQGFVTDCRAALFKAVTRHAGEGGDARWVTVLINDLAALRNYALRGTVRLWTSITAASAAAIWVFLTMPHLRSGLIPLVLGAGAILLLVWPLSRAITRQRSQRGRLNRFLVRRVRAELAGEPAAKGHGFQRLSILSGELAHAAVRRAASAGAMDAVATLAGLAAALVIVWQTIGSQDTTGLAGSLTLLGFIAGRLLESARALHARIGGRIALERLSRLLALAPAPVTLPRRPRAPLKTAQVCVCEAPRPRAAPSPGTTANLPKGAPSVNAKVTMPTFRAASSPGVPECFIANARPGQNVLVVVHGISRNAAEMATRFAAHPAFANTTIIAPLFTKDSFGQYQQLQTRSDDQTPADVALIGLLDEVAEEYGIVGNRFGLFGFSGGAQMAHRFAMFHPERVERLCIVSAGWYSLPRADLAYPYGIGNADGEPLVGPVFLDIPTTVIVGNRDTRVDSAVRQHPLIDEHQGRNRLRRARSYVRAVHAYAEAMGKTNRAQLLTLHDVSHDFNQCVADGELIDVAVQALL